MRTAGESGEQAIGGFATVLGALYTTVREVFRTLPRAWVEEILTEENPAKRG